MAGLGDGAGAYSLLTPDGAAAPFLILARPIFVFVSGPA